MVAKDLILFYLWEAGTAAYNAWSLVLMDLIVGDMNAAVEHHNAISVIIDIVVLYPPETSFNAEDAFRPRLIDQII